MLSWMSTAQFSSCSFEGFASRACKLFFMPTTSRVIYVADESELGTEQSLAGDGISGDIVSSSIGWEVWCRRAVAEWRRAPKNFFNSLQNFRDTGDKCYEWNQIKNAQQEWVWTRDEKKCAAINHQRGGGGFGFWWPFDILTLSKVSSHFRWWYPC